MSPMSPSPRAHLDARAVLTMVGCCALWGLNQVAVKVALPEVGPLTQLAVRSGLAAVLVLAWMARRGVSFSVRDGTLGPGLLAGTLFAVEFAAIFVALQFTTAARSVVFINTSPFVVATVLALLVPAERLRRGQVVGLLIAFAGIAWAFGEAGNGRAAPGGGSTLKGDALALVGATLWGLTTVVIRTSALRRAASEKTLAYQVVVAAVLAPLGAWGLGESMPDWAQLSSLAWLSLFYQGVVVTFASYLVWFWMLGRYPATQLQAFVFLSPVFGTVFAGALLGEPLTLRLLVALLAVGVGLSLLNRRAPAR